MIVLGRNVRSLRRMLPSGESLWVCRWHRRTDGLQTITLCFPLDRASVRSQLLCFGSDKRSKMAFGWVKTASKNCSRLCLHPEQSHHLGYPSLLHRTTMALTTLKIRGSWFESGWRRKGRNEWRSFVSGCGNSGVSKGIHSSQARRQRNRFDLWWFLGHAWHRDAKELIFYCCVF